MVDFGYLFDFYIQMLVIEFIPKLKTSPQQYFYRNTAIGRRILYRKTGWPNSVMWPEAESNCRPLVLQVRANHLT